MKIKRIAIVGGGTAGWLAANHLGSELNADPDICITVIESIDVPSIGVGEGTVPYIMNGLKRFSISEALLLTQCDATFKQGIKFANWLDKDLHGDHAYYHPFDVPYPSGFDVSGYWLNQHGALPFDDVGIQARMCELGLAPKKKSAGEYVGDLSYAYHFDAAKFAKLLAQNAQDKFSVKHHIATIKDVQQSDNGDITHLVTSEGASLEFDFYIDCSGFSSILIDKALHVPFISKADQILTDTVLVQQVEINAQDEIKPYTLATAHKAGWIWDIPLTTRRGTGFVYSSRHMTEQEATLLYAEYLGIPHDGFLPRKIDMEIGYRESFWQNNCVALGLAQGFVEPLEATSILLTDFSAELLARNFPRNKTDIEAYSPYFNQVITYAWDRVVDFIKLHYCISDRKDSSFWLDNQDPKTISNELTKRLEKFKLRPPQQSDFFSRFDMFDEKNFLYVLYGMKFPTKPPVLSQREIENSQALLSSNDKLVSHAANYLLKHKDWLVGLKTAMEKSGR